MLAHLYSRISNILHIFNPHQMPKPLHINTSSINASHQHSMKLGSKWANVISVISHIIEMAHKMPMCRIRTALNIHPRKWAYANTSTCDQIRSIVMCEQLTPYSCFTNNIHRLIRNMKKTFIGHLLEVKMSHARLAYMVNECSIYMYIGYIFEIMHTLSISIRKCLRLGSNQYIISMILR